MEKKQEISFLTFLMTSSKPNNVWKKSCSNESGLWQTKCFCLEMLWRKNVWGKVTRGYVSTGKCLRNNFTQGNVATPFIIDLQKLYWIQLKRSMICVSYWVDPKKLRDMRLISNLITFFFIWIESLWGEGTAVAGRR